MHASRTVTTNVRVREKPHANREPQGKLALRSSSTPVRVPEPDDQSPEAQIFTALVKLGQDKTTGLRLGRMVRRLMTGNLMQLAAAMQQAGAFAGMTLQAAHRELGLRLDAERVWEATEMAALLTCLKVNIVDFLSLFTTKPRKG